MEIEERVCRTCLRGDAKLVPLDVKFENELQGKKMLEFLIGTDVLDCEAFSGICEPCKSTLTVSCNFKQQCMVSNEKIIEYLLEKEQNHNVGEDENSQLKDPLSDDDDEIPAELVVKEEDPDTFHEAAEQFELPKSSEGIDTTKKEKKKIKPRRSSRIVERKCNICQLDFPNVAAYQEHYRRKHRKKQNQKPPGMIKKRGLLPKSERINHCGICEKSFKGLSNYQDHCYSKHTPIPGTRSRATNLLDGLEDKKKSTKNPKQNNKLSTTTESPENQQKPRSCLICNISFPSAKEYYVHRQAEHHSRFLKKINKIREKIVCEDCGKCVLRTGIKNHRLTHAGHLFHCSLCGRGLKSKTNLEIHMRIHTQEKNYTCKYCEMSFIHSQTLKAHVIRFHETHKQPKEVFQCTICDSKFNRKYRYEYHMRRHRGDLRHECPTCQKRFVSKYALNVHLVSHTGERNHICTVCGKGFGTRNVLNIHMVTHTGEKNYECDVCGKSFTQCHVLRSHMRTVHPEHPVPPPRAILKKNYKGNFFSNTQSSTQIAKNDENEVQEFVEEDGA
ncbi:zinc finger protein 227-like [Lutzomyia longipalpis]|uniref:zinc finger protein 227-like n=1 Tax=Lutzomyia longipalpis TaxID=7200 RepID=UPI00248431D8|nr:zinc finger protein 227-like [Lutzomyia longipalpis]